VQKPSSFVIYFHTTHNLAKRLFWATISRYHYSHIFLLSVDSFGFGYPETIVRRSRCGRTLRDLRR